jgi:hypothetical protein
MFTHLAPTALTQDKIVNKFFNSILPKLSPLCSLYHQPWHGIIFFSELYIFSIESMDWVLADLGSPSDTISPIDMEETELLKDPTNENITVKNIINRFCTLLTNNIDSCPDVSRLLTSKKSNLTDKIILSFSCVIKL